MRNLAVQGALHDILAIVGIDIQPAIGVIFTELSCARRSGRKVRFPP